MTTRTHVSILSLGLLTLASVAYSGGPADLPNSPKPGTITIKDHTAFGNHTVTAKAHFLVADAARSGCLDLENQKDCSRYLSPKDVFLSAGTEAEGLANGKYYFTVIAPGYQNTAIRDGLDGNLSDRIPGHAGNDRGIGDAMRNRVFEVSNHEISAYSGSHERAHSADGQLMIGVGPFDQTPNSSGVYAVAICPVGVTLSVQCRFDAFRTGIAVPMARAVISGRSYYDKNVNGKLDQEEPTLDHGVIGYWDNVQGSVQVGSDGGFSVAVEPDTYTFSQEPSSASWVQTGPQVSQAVIVGDVTSELMDDQSYAITIERGAAADGIQFGSVCLGGGGSRRIGYWASMASKAMLGADDLSMLVSLSLYGHDGQPFDPKSLDGFQHWLRTESGTDLRTQLSAQLAVAALNTRNGLVNDQALVFMSNANAADDLGFGILDDLITEAEGSLAKEKITPTDGVAVIAHWRTLNNALKEVNNNAAFVQESPNFCSPHF